MGNEFVYPLGIAIGLALFAWLLFRSFIPRARPYALPTLLARCPGRPCGAADRFWIIAQRGLPTGS
jgi:hypothetical protein